MHFQFYYEKLLSSKEYIDFKRDYPDAYACSGFFVLDLEKDGEGNQVNFDFWIPSFKKMYSFRVSGKTEMNHVENFDKRDFEELGMNYTFEIERVGELIKKEMEEKEIKGKMKKLLFSLQRLNGEDFLIATVFLDNMGLLKAHYNIADDKIVFIEKKSFLDMFKIFKK